MIVAPALRACLFAVSNWNWQLALGGR
jgi:hypothetical protein